MLGKQLVIQNRIYAWFKQGNHFSQWFSAVIFCTDCELLLGNDYTCSPAESYELSAPEQQQTTSPSVQIPK